jgi:hypothetical protein
MEIQGRPLLTLALQYGAADLVQTLKTMGADFHRKDEFGMTPIMWATLIKTEGLDIAPSEWDEEMRIAMDRVQRARAQVPVLQNRMIMDIKPDPQLLALQQPQLEGDAGGDLILRRMEAGWASEVLDSTIRSLEESKGRQQTILGLLSKMETSSAYPEGKVAFARLKYEAQLHVLRMLASGESSLSPLHLLAIYLFTSSQFITEQVAKTFANWEANALWQPFVSCLYQAVESLPVFTGEVYRAIREADLQPFFAGNVLAWPTFSTASVDWRAAGEMINSRKGVALIIQSARGRRLGRLGKNDVDDEVLFLPGSRFQVKQLYCGTIYVLQQRNLREKSAVAQEEDLDRARKGRMTLVVELVEL